jgi:hypothetical protein
MASLLIRHVATIEVAMESYFIIYYRLGSRRPPCEKNPQRPTGLEKAKRLAPGHQDVYPSKSHPSLVQYNDFVDETCK